MDSLKKIIEEVYSTLGTGHTEAIYHKAMEVDLGIGQFKYDTKKMVPVLYRGYQIGHRELDLVVMIDDDCYILELKAVGKLNHNHRDQLKSYLRMDPTCKGLLINFGDKLEIEPISV